jgi:hypothetical protein
MSDAVLRAKLIRLAHTRPELRSAILPLVATKKVGKFSAGAPLKS